MNIERILDRLTRKYPDARIDIEDNAIVARFPHISFKWTIIEDEEDDNVYVKIQERSSYPQHLIDDGTIRPSDPRKWGRPDVRQYPISPRNEAQIISLISRDIAPSLNAQKRMDRGELGGHDLNYDFTLESYDRFPRRIG